MATDKKSFLFYIDWIDTFRALPKDKSYDLFMHMLAYVNLEKPTSTDPLITALFPIFKNQLKRDLKKWQHKSEQNKENALKRWNKDESDGKSGMQTDANASNPMQTDAKDADNDNDKVIVKDKVIKDIVYRKAEFTNSLSLFLDKNPGKYSKELYHAFFNYWTEHGENDKKMRFEKEKSFSLAARLQRWKSNQEKWLKSNPKSEKVNAGTLLKQKYGL